MSERRRRGPGPAGGAVRTAPRTSPGGSGAGCGRAGRPGRARDAGRGSGRGAGRPGAGSAAPASESPRRPLSLRFRPGPEAPRRGARPPGAALSLALGQPRRDRPGGGPWGLPSPREAATSPSRLQGDRQDSVRGPRLPSPPGQRGQGLQGVPRVLWFSGSPLTPPLRISQTQPGSECPGSF